MFFVNKRTRDPNDFTDTRTGVDKQRGMRTYKSTTCVADYETGFSFVLGWPKRNKNQFRRKYCHTVGEPSHLIKQTYINSHLETENLSRLMAGSNGTAT